jgi:hypothetical protein
MRHDGRMAGKSKVHVGGGVYAPARIHVTDDQLSPLNLDVAITADLALDGRRYVVDEMTFKRRPDGAPVTGEMIRKIPVHSVLQFAVLSEVDMHLLSPDLLRRIRAEGPTNETLAVVAQLYILAELGGVPPAKNVCSILGVPIGTANNWIRRAKDRGHLDG